jgi:hypothetical protein
VIFLLLQAVPTVAQEASTHASLVMLAIGALLSSLLAVLKVLLGMMERRINEKFVAVENHNAHQDKQLNEMSADLRRYETHVAVGVKESAEIHAAIVRVGKSIDDHVQKEEGTTWLKIDNLVATVTEMKLANELAHSSLVNGQATMGMRVDAMERKMPNGELQKLSDAFATLASKSGERAARMKRSIRGKK